MIRVLPPVDNAKEVAEIDVANFDAIVVAGGHGDVQVVSRHGIPRVLAMEGIAGSGSGQGNDGVSEYRCGQCGEVVQLEPSASVRD